MSEILDFLYRDLESLGLAVDYAAEVSEAIRQSPIFEHFSPDEIGTLCKYLRCFAAPANTALLREGEVGDHLLLILSGHVAVRKADVFGRTIGIATAGPGDILGEMSLIDGEHRFATCTTVEPTRFAVLTRLDLNEIMALHPRLANKFLCMLLQILIGRLRDSGMKVISQAAQPIP